MNHEISQLDIPDRQLLASNARPSIWTEIGEAQITHTIFGRAKVRIIRKNDNRHRLFWFTGIAAIVLAAAAWQGLFTSQQAEQSPGADQPPVGIKEPASTPATQSEKNVTPVTPPEVTKELSVPIQAETDKPPIPPKSMPQQVHRPISPEPKFVHPEMPRLRPNSVQPEPIFAQPRPVTSEPQAAVRPQMAPANNAIKSPITTLPANTSVAKPTGAVAPALSATKPVAQPAASSPASVIQLSDPVQRPPAAPAPDNQPPALDNAQSK